MAAPTAFSAARRAAGRRRGESARCLPSRGSRRDRDAVAQFAAERLATVEQVAFQHYPDQVAGTGQALVQHAGEDAGLVQRVLAAVGVTAIDHHPRGDALAFQGLAHGLHLLGAVVRTVAAAAQHHMGVRIAAGLDQRRVTVRVEAEMAVAVGRRTDRVAGDADAAVGAVLEAHRQAEAADQLAVDLRFAGARADRRPAQQVVEVAGGQRLQEFGGQRQAEAQHVQHQLPGQRQAGGHVVAAIQVRIVGEALPAHRGAWLFHVGAHHQEQLAVEFVAQRGEAFGVFEGGAGIVDRTGTDYHQQARVVAVEDGADGVAAGGDLAGQLQRQRLAGLEFERAGQAFQGGTGGGAGQGDGLDVRRKGGQCGYG